MEKFFSQANLARACWFVMPLLLCLAAVPRLMSGLAVDAAFPVPVYLVMNHPLPQRSYLVAADILGAADGRDGRTAILRAEAMAAGGEPAGRILPLVKKGLSLAPASVRGWLLLSEALRDRKPADAGAALTVALSLAPYDYTVAGRRARDVVRQWGALDTVAKQDGIRQLRLLWEEPFLHAELEPLFHLKRAPELMAQALKYEPEEIRALNRWLSGRALGLPQYSR